MKLEMLQLSWHDFDQTDKGWRSLPVEQMPGMIWEYIKTHGKNLKKQQLIVLYWHMGQMLAILDKTDKAISAMRLSLSHDDMEWNNYVKATIAFLKKDRDAFMIYATGENYNSETINRLLKHFNSTYEEAYGAE